MSASPSACAGQSSAGTGSATSASWSAGAGSSMSASPSACAGQSSAGAGSATSASWSVGAGPGGSAISEASCAESPSTAGSGLGESSESRASWTSTRIDPASWMVGCVTSSSSRKSRVDCGSGCSGVRRAVGSSAVTWRNRSSSRRSGSSHQGPLPFGGGSWPSGVGIGRAGALVALAAGSRSASTAPSSSGSTISTFCSSACACAGSSLTSGLPRRRRPCSRSSASAGEWTA